MSEIKVYQDTDGLVDVHLILDKKIYGLLKLKWQSCSIKMQGPY
jgi:hypothetical protein